MINVNNCTKTATQPLFAFTRPVIHPQNAYKRMSSSLFLMRNNRCRLCLETLEQESGVDHEGDSNGEQRVHEYVQFRLSESVFAQPFQNVGLGMQIASEYARETFPEVHNCWEMGHTPFTGVSGVRHLHECYVEVVRFAVDVLQFFHYDPAFVIVQFV